MAVLIYLLHVSTYFRLIEQGSFIPRANAIYVDTLGCPFITHGFCHLKDASFRACIRSDIDIADERNDGGNIDYLSRPLQLEQPLTDLLRSHEGRFEIN